MSAGSDVGDAFRSMLTGAWRPGEPETDLPPLWQRAVDAGWFGLEGEDSVAALVAVERELGRQACPLPIADSYVARTLLPPGHAEAVASGSSRIAVTCAEVVEHAVVVGLAVPTDVVLVLGHGRLTLHRVVEVVPDPGLSRPAAGVARLGDLIWEAAVTVAATDRARTLMRLALGARAAAGAAELHRLAVEHAITRVQFGRPVGAFGAVQQRAAACEIDVTATRLLVDSAAEAFDRGAEHAEIAAEVAFEHLSAAARRVLLGAHHTLGAVGYFEEHLGPWVFRRVHADLAHAAGMTSVAGGVADRLVDGEDLPPLVFDAASEDFRTEVRAVIDGLDANDGSELDRHRSVQSLVDRGWLGFGWPEEYGGRAASVAEQLVLNEELTYHRVPVEIELASVLLLGGSILRHGSADQRARFLPLVREGRLRFCLGYSEPETGSDLASLRTKAVVDGDTWVVTGQKIWTTRAEQADYLWLAARTDPDATPRHAGITVFLVPMETPGITVLPLTALSGERAAVVHLDQVVVPDSCRVGDLHGGWRVITDALAGERIMMGGVGASIKRVLDDVLVSVRAVPALIGPRGSAARQALGRGAADLQALRALVARALDPEMLTAGMAASMAGVLGGELAESFAESMVDIFGLSALLADPDGIGGGGIENLLRQSVMYVVGGGTNDIQRGLIARGLGLPR